MTLQQNTLQVDAEIAALEDSIDGLNPNSTTHQDYLKSSAKLEAEWNQKQTAGFQLA